MDAVGDRRRTSVHRSGLQRPRLGPPLAKRCRWDRSGAASNEPTSGPRLDQGASTCARTQAAVNASFGEISTWVSISTAIGTQSGQRTTSARATMIRTQRASTSAVLWSSVNAYPDRDALRQPHWPPPARWHRSDRVERSLDHAWHHRAHADGCIYRREFGSQAVRETEHRMLRTRCRADARERGDRAHRRRVHHVPRLPSTGVFGAQRPGLHGSRPTNRRRSHGANRRAAAPTSYPHDDPGVVHCDMQLSESLDRDVSCALDRVGIGDIDRPCARTSAPLSARRSACDATPSSWSRS